MTRVQFNVINRVERRFLDWACGRVPATVTPDHLTLFGILGALLVAASYAASRYDHGFLLLAVFGYVMHWFGDSMDGSLARHRKTSRPRYGYFLDHSVDAMCVFLMVGGLGLTDYVRLDVPLLVVLGYFALSIHVFLRNHVTGTFQLSFMGLGPTEFRLALVIITLWMYVAGFSGAASGIAGLTRYDVTLLVMGGVLLVLFVVNTANMVAQLRSLEGDGRSAPQPAAEPRRPANSRVVRRGDVTPPEGLRPAISTPRAF